MEKRIQVAAKPAGFLGSVVVGLAFAFGWTPCIGPILAGILALAAQQETVGRGIGLLITYSAGLAVPFFLTGLLVNTFFNVFNRLKRHMRRIEIGSGVLLIAVGALIFSNNLTMLATALQDSPVGKAVSSLEQKLK